jgi:replicative DNA helicase
MASSWNARDELVGLDTGRCGVLWLVTNHALARQYQALAPTSMTPAPPTNQAAEWHVISRLLDKPALIPEVVGTQLESTDFVGADTSMLYAQAAELFYGDLPVDPLIVAEHRRKQLAKVWSLDEAGVPDALLARIARTGYAENVLEHAAIVKRLSTGRQLMRLAERAIGEISDGRLSPQEVGDKLSSESLKVTAGTTRRSELLSWMDVGREYALHLRRQRLAHEKGIELAVYTGMPFIDDWTRGVAPTELIFLAGEPGIGKTAIAWECARGFAERQLKKPLEHRVGTLVLSLEMGLIPSTGRVVQSLTNIDGMRLREGNISDREWRHILSSWKANENLPIKFNFSSNFRLSQMRALIVEAIRKFNVGFVIIDHFRMIDTDERYQNPNQEDEVKVRFLKENLAKDLNIGVMCLAHTVKIGRGEGERRPRLSDLRGSGQIAANADFVAIMHRPAKHAGPEEMEDSGIKETDAELIWAKNRHGTDGIASFTFEPQTMTARVRDLQLAPAGFEPLQLITND